MNSIRVALAGRGEPRHAPLTRGQRIDAGQHQPARARAGGEQLVMGPPLKHCRTADVRQLASLRERGARRGSLSLTTQQRPELNQRSRVFEARFGGLERGHRLTRTTTPARAERA
jgi:hypothetical protein